MSHYGEQECDFFALRPLDRLQSTEEVDIPEEA